MASTKNTLRAFPIFENADMSGDLVGPVTNIQFLDNVGVQLVWSGDAEGTFGVQGSLNHVQDQQGVVTNPGDWVSLTFSSAPIADGADGSILIDMNQLSFPWIRVIYTADTGTGSLNGFIGAKSV